MELGLTFDAKPTWEICDIECNALQDRLQKSDSSELIQKPFCRKASTVLLGAVMTEAISAAYWSDVLLVCSLSTQCSGGLH